MQGTVTDQGLTLADGRRVGWSDVYHVDWTEKEAVIATAVGMVHTARADGLRAEAKIAPWEAQRDAAMDAADPLTAAEWTGAPPRRIHVQPPKLGRVGQFVVRLLNSLAVTAMIVAILVVNRDAWGPAAVVMFVVMLVVSLVVIWVVSAPRLTRTPTGIQLNARRIPWRDIQRADLITIRTNKQTVTFLQLQTRQGRIGLPKAYQNWLELCDEVRAAVTYRTRAAAADLARGVYAPMPTSADHGLWLDGRGLSVIKGDSVKQYPLSSLQAPEWTGDGPTIRAGGKDVGAETFFDSGLLAQQLERRLGIELQEVTTAEGDLHPEVLERWLGVAPGGVLRCRLHTAAIAGGLLVAGLGFWFARSMATIGGRADPESIGVALQIGIIVLIGLSALLGSARRIDADAQGLAVRRGRQRALYAWADLTDIKSYSFETTITTASGDTIRLSRWASGSKRVLGLVRRLLSVKYSGVSLPSTAPIPETALTVTPAGPATASAEGGLSVAPAPQQRLDANHIRTTQDDPSVRA
ncbi:MAG TPA: hypothetical protein DCZ72_00335 [Armatimonadetes bacterium]|nr:hypothetical protein [Armatimonadota bacterium]